MIERRKIILVSPSVTQKMGGEAIKSFQFLSHLVRGGYDVSVVVHERSEAELRVAFPGIDVRIVRDTPLQLAAWHALRWNDVINMLFNLHARRHIRAVLSDHPDAVVHYLSPVSPVLPRLPVRGATNVLGPVTGNINYPPGFRHLEPRTAAVRRRLHQGTQRVIGWVLGDKARFDRVLVSGGQRTRQSLAWGGCREDRMVDVVDSGITERVLARPLVRHEGVNHRFVTSCRLVAYKGVAFAVEALATATSATLDVYGDGPELERLTALATRLGVAERVRFLGWTPHDQFIDRLPDYRGFVLSSLAEANGIVVQEAMSAGVPIICLRWGGPELLADADSGILIEPTDPAGVVAAVAAAMERLAGDPDLANRLATRARDVAEARFSWDRAAESWIGSYPAAV